MDSPHNPHKVLDVLGENELQKYPINEIQEVYRCSEAAVSVNKIAIRHVPHHAERGFNRQGQYVLSRRRPQ